MDPKMLAIILFHLFLWEIFLKQSDFLSIYCSPNFYHFSKTQTRLGLNCMNKAQGHLVECTKCTFETRLMPPLCVVQILLFEALLSLALSPAWTWGFYPANLKSFLQGFVQKDMHPKFMVVLLQSSLTKILTPCLILIKEGYFNLSTMLNLKSLWKYLENTSKPEQTNANKGSMIFFQTLLIWR